MSLTYTTINVAPWLNHDLKNVNMPEMMYSLLPSPSAITEFLLELNTGQLMSIKLWKPYQI